MDEGCYLYIENINVLVYLRKGSVCGVMSDECTTFPIAHDVEHMNIV